MPGRWTRWPNKTPVDFVGYGVQFQANIPGNQLPQPPPFYRWTGPKQRMYAPSELVSGISSTATSSSSSPSTRAVGRAAPASVTPAAPTCSGGTDTVLGVNSYVTNVNCGGVGYSQRVDVPEVLDWINSFLS